MNVINLIQEMVHNIHGSYKVIYYPDGPKAIGSEKARVFEMDFTPPFKRKFYLFTVSFSISSLICLIVRCSHV